MKSLRILCLCLCLLPALRAGDTPDFDAAAWAPLFTRLQAGAPLVSSFNEERHYPFRMVPLKLTGELRFDPAHGLSLHYLTPEEMTLIVDQRGLLMRDRRGREREAPPDHRAQATANALLLLLHFDLKGLQETFHLAGNLTDGNWTLQLTPIDPELSDSLGSITVTGRENRVSTIVMAKSSSQHIDITVTSATPRTTFTADDLALYFR